MHAPAVSLELQITVMTYSSFSSCDWMSLAPFARVMSCLLQATRMCGTEEDDKTLSVRMAYNNLRRTDAVNSIVYSHNIVQLHRIYIYIIYYIYIYI